MLGSNIATAFFKHQQWRNSNSPRTGLGAGNRVWLPDQYAMVDRYAKFATENLAVAAARIGTPS